MFSTIDYVQDLISQGRVLFHSKVHASLTTAGYVYQIKTCNNAARYILEIAADTKTAITYKRGVTVGTGGDGTAVQLYNKHGGYGDDICGVELNHTPTVSGGTTVAEFSLGTDTLPGRSAEAHRYTFGVIKPNTSDTITIKPAATTDAEVYFLFWED